MKNPLVVFTGLALASLAALVAVTMERPRDSASEKLASGEAPATIAEQPAMKDASGAKPPEAAKAPESKAPEGSKAPDAKMAATETKPADTVPEATTTETKPVDNSAPKVAGQAAEEAPKSAEPAQSAESVKKPEFDTVRVESDGTAIVAGQAKPGSEVTLKLDGAEIGKGMANEEGAWVVIPDTPLPKGAHEITAEQKDGEADAPVASDQSVAVAVAGDGKKAPMIAVLEPGQATKVLQSGAQESAEQVAANQPPSTGQGNAEPAEQQTAIQPPEKSPEQPKQATAPQISETPQQEASAEPAEQQVETQPVGKSTEEQEQAALQAGQDTELKQSIDQPPAIKQPEVKTLPLSLDAVDYSERGDIIFTGRAAAGTAVRLYVDNQPVGDAIVDGGGNWTFSGTQSISPGTHSLRADQIDAAGKVVGRIELPFLREESSRVATLTENDKAVAPPTANADKAVEAVEAVEPPPAKTDKAGEPAAAEQQQAAVEPPAVDQKQPDSETAAGESQSQPETPAQSQASKTPEGDNSQAGEQAKATAADDSKAAEQKSAAAQTEESTGAQPEPKMEMSETAPAPEPATETPEPAPPTDQANSAVEPEARADAGAAASEADLEAKPRSGRVVIQPNNNLWKLSRVIYGRGLHYTVIYSANKDQIRNPNLIYPGQIFTIPNASPPESIDPKRKLPLTADEGAGTVE